MKIEKLLITITVLLQLYILQLWLVCQRFADGFHFSAFDTKLIIEQGIHNDGGTTTHIARFFHNKLDISLTEIIGKYLQFWDFRFLILFISLIGIFGLFSGLWYLVQSKKKRSRIWIIITVLTILPLIEVFKISMPFWLRLFILYLPYVSFSLYGLWQFMQHHTYWGKVIVLILLVISIWYILIFQNDIIGDFCYN